VRASADRRRATIQSVPVGTIRGVVGWTLTQGNQARTDAERARKR